MSADCMKKIHPIVVSSRSKYNFSMLSLNNLPELILYYIFKHTVKGNRHFGVNLPYLAVCYNWRCAALPLIYREVYIALKWDHFKDPRWNTNIGLFVSTGYMSFARRLNMLIEDRGFTFDQELELFLNVLAMGPIQRSSGSQRKLIALGGNGGSLSILTEDGLQAVAEAVSSFAQSFSRIQEMKLYPSLTCYRSRQINTALVSTFANHLRSLDSGHLYDEKITYPLANLTSLTYECDIGSSSFLSKVNIQLLEKLHLSSLPIDFSWSVFQENSSDSVFMDFSNLKHLRLDFANNIRLARNPQQGEDLAAFNDQVRLQLPNLQTLYYKNDRDGFILRSEVTSPHLDAVVLELTGDAFCILGKLPIESINYMDIKLTSRPDDMSEFLIAAKHLFNTVDNPVPARVDFGPIRLKKVKQIHWPNITYVRLDQTDICELIYIFSYMPQITSIYALTFYCDLLDDTSVQYLQTNQSKLRTLHIWKLFDDEVGVAVNNFLKMIAALKCLRRLDVIFIGDVIRTKVQALFEERPWLKKLEITS